MKQRWIKYAALTVAGAFLLQVTSCVGVLTDILVQNALNIVLAELLRQAVTTANPA